MIPSFLCIPHIPVGYAGAIAEALAVTQHMGYANETVKESDIEEITMKHMKSMKI